MNLKACALLCCSLCGTAATAQVTFVFDYTYDANGFFGGDNIGRRTYLEAAGAYVAGFITNTPLAAITPDSTNSWTPLIFDPADISATVSPGNIAVPANTIIVYAGSSVLLGADIVAYGGPAGGSVPDGSSWDWISTLLYRGNGTSRMPPIGSLTFTTQWPWYFDDDISTVENFGTDMDFFSVAVHELFHVLGFGTLDAWIDQVDAESGTFTGAASAAEFGSDVPLDGLQQHWIEGTMSFVYGTALVQETAMDPSIYEGARKYVTDLDAAALVDIGYRVTAVPEPAMLAGLLGLVALLVAVLRQRTRA